jgi:hypothetical protein
MFKNIILITAVLFSNLFSFDIMTENYPPFNYENKNEKVTGMTTDIVKEIMKSTGENYQIKLMPWARAYKQIINKPNKILFSMIILKSLKTMIQMFIIWVTQVNFHKYYLIFLIIQKTHLNTNRLIVSK